MSYCLRAWKRIISPVSGDVFAAFDLRNVPLAITELIKETILRLFLSSVEMAFTQTMLEEIVAWCRDSLELDSARRQARSHFFGGDDERPIQYWEGAGEYTSKDRRFLGYFLFNWGLPSGEKPAQVAVERLYEGSTQSDALAAVSSARFVFAGVRTILGRDVYLEVEEEQFQVRNPQWATMLHRDVAVAAHLAPVRHGYWLLGPGWVNLPYTLGPGIRANLADLQMDPIGLERMLQGRDGEPG